jgi:hypothetical protein
MAIISFTFPAVEAGDYSNPKTWRLIGAGMSLLRIQALEAL